MKSFEARLTGYLVAILLGGVVEFYIFYCQVVEALKTDKSAGAIMGFVPFLIPLFLMRPAAIVASLALVGEVAYLISKRRRA